MSDRLTEVLGAMGPVVDPGGIDDRLSAVHQASARRRRHRTLVRSAIGAAAAAFVLAAGLALVDRASDQSQQVVVDQPADTTPPPWMVTSLPDPTPVPQTPPALRDDQLDVVVGVELRTWYFDDQAEGFWTASTEQTAAIVEALRTGEEPFPRPDQIDHAYVRFELIEGGFALLEMDVESGWVEPDRRLPEDLTRQIREGLNDVVGHPWQELDLGDENEFVIRIIDAATPPWTTPEQATGALLDAFDLHDADARGLFGELVFEGHGPFVLIRTRGGDDSTRGVDYRLALVEGPVGWEISGGLWRALCLRSPSHWSEAAGTWGCL
jgi:hypothetical protein